MRNLGKNISVALCAMLFTSSALSANDDEVNELDSVTVTSNGTSSYSTNEKPSINRGNIKLDNIPKSTQTISKELIADYQVDSIEDILTLSSSVVSLGDYNGRESMFAIRGFNYTPILRDGINFTSSIADPASFNFESIEIVKGPSSLQYGQGGVGGLINIVKKKADKKETTGELTLEATSEKEYSTKFDIAGSMNKDGSARYRIVSSYTYENEDSYNTDTKKIFIAPSVSIDLNDINTLDLIAEYYDVNEPTDYGTPIKSDGTPAGDYDDILSHPDDHMTSTQRIVGFDLKSKFNTWDSILRFRHLDYIMDIGGTYLPVAYSESTNTLTRRFAYMYYHNKEDVLQYTLNKELETAGIKHNFSMGVDLSRLKQEADGFYYLSKSYSIDYSAQNFESSMESYSSGYDFVDGYDIDKQGIYLQDNIEFNEQFVANIGVRHDSFDITEEDNDRYSKSATSPSVGLVYKPTLSTSLYTNYSKSVQMQMTRYQDTNGHLIDPEEGKGYELGIKQKLFNNNFNMTLSAYNLKKSNVPVYDSSTRKYTASDDVKNKGIEFDLAGNITPAWSLIASYGYIDTKVPKVQLSSATYYDKKVVGVPEHSANVFSKYYINPKLYLGAGARYIGSRFVDYANTVKVDSVTVFNATAGYSYNKSLKVKFGIKNLTDKVYYESVGANGLGSTIRNNYLADPRTYTLSLTYAF